jgi:hypothetical protein
MDALKENVCGVTIPQQQQQMRMMVVVIAAADDEVVCWNLLLLFPLLRLLKVPPSKITSVAAADVLCWWGWCR